MQLLLIVCSGALTPKARSVLSGRKNSRPVPVPVPPKINAEIELKKPRYLGVIDFECTCEPGWGYLHEIIEFPCVLLDTQELKVIDEFHSYVKPTENATLSKFCTELTGIEQATVDAAPELPQVLQELDAWLVAHNVLDDFALATDGWDLRHFLDSETTRKNIFKKSYLNAWCDLTRSFDKQRAMTSKRRLKPPPHIRARRTNMGKMLRFYKLSFKGRPHSGIDDARNLAIIACALLKENAPVVINDSLEPAKLRRQQQLSLSSPPHTSNNSTLKTTSSSLFTSAPPFPEGTMSAVKAATLANNNVSSSSILV